ncbi:xylose isomerase-like TIM barrel domain protein [Formosa agariphila KMM 3901]|uniref:Xylose isomerase-like TIM barrel domain protein n=1 Tax=Formosa agariphila (strain DSM 15362 / KCTC 12365 / LMG 23005 / KMM 3901 / M-2Alg 35-1) TaxID=1347342 RepID=T2KLG9_FORAG|nr:TIM barrel protein [Formosa agariphila]CDF79281.1 xylose isomerase-like TIM barrel domain protein [Formosa agariphila KMM 3901]
MDKRPNTYSRRDFAKLTALGLGSIPLYSFQSGLEHRNFNAADELEVHLFSKHLQFLDYNAMSEAAAQMGFDGLDLTVRPKGHVLPERVTVDLPKAVTAMKAQGLKTKLMSTAVWDISKTSEKTVLETASQLGFTHYRTNWLSYPEDRSLDDSLKLYAKQANALELLNAELNLIGGYQNHAGNHVGAAIWDLDTILKDLKGTHLGCQYDIRHAVVEGAKSWELGLRRIKPYINTIVIKDVKWGLVNGSWELINVPLGEGMVDFKRYFSLLKQYNIQVPVSLHVEYDLGGAERGLNTISMPRQEVLSRITKDLIYLRQAWKDA